MLVYNRMTFALYHKIIHSWNVFVQTQDHEAVWQQMAQQEQKDYGAMDPIWDMSQNSLQAGPNEIQESARELRGTVDDPRFVYSKVRWIISFERNNNLK